MDETKHQDSKSKGDRNCRHHATLFTSIQADAGDIREACSGLGTNDRAMVSIICSRTKPHLARVDQYYHSMFNRSLDKQVRQECHGTYRWGLIEF